MTEVIRLDSESTLSLSGEWTLGRYAQLARSVKPPEASISHLDASALAAIDTAGATLLVNLVGARRLNELLPSATGLSEERRALIQAVADAVADRGQAEWHRPRYRFGDGLETVGRSTIAAWSNLLRFLSFLGLTLATLVVILPRPWRWRFTAWTAQMQQVGMNAIPIVMLLNFLVGAVVAFLGATVLREFGASIYTVDLVAYAFMRELGVLLAAILLAGRTASAFAAQLGSMKVNEELDALRVQGLSYIELLVLPRLLAVFFSLPLLGFLAILSGIAGGAAVALFALDISLTQYISIVREVPARHLVLGLVKAPVFAVVIALIGCLEGFKVASSAQSVGEHTTSAVVQSLVAVIILNAVGALFFMVMMW